ncbi:MAG: hypothetical protein HQL56_17985 [Magnetococcales bacterium]|nr:hypothetical protein [Magnetococcales bacterium]
MRTLSYITHIMHNPALGAVIQRSFVDGCEDGRQTEELVTYPMIFLPIPLALHESTAKKIKATNQPSGLLGLGEKLQSDVYLLHKMVESSRNLSMDSLAMALACGLLIFDSEQGVIVSRRPALNTANIPERVRPMLNTARKLGRLCQGRSLSDISLHLKVYF